MGGGNGGSEFVLMNGSGLCQKVNDTPRVIVRVFVNGFCVMNFESILKWVWLIWVALVLNEFWDCVDWDRPILGNLPWNIVLGL